MARPRPRRERESQERCVEAEDWECRERAGWRGLVGDESEWWVRWKWEWGIGEWRSAAYAGVVAEVDADEEGG